MEIRILSVDKLKKISTILLTDEPNIIISVFPNNPFPLNTRHFCCGMGTIKWTSCSSKLLFPELKKIMRIILVFAIRFLYHLRMGIFSGAGSIIKPGHFSGGSGGINH